MIIHSFVYIIYVDMIKILKKNQIVIFAIALMLVTAGYLNYTMNQVETAETSAIYNDVDIAGIGDARLVSNNNVINGNNISNDEQNKIVEQNNVTSENNADNNAKNNVTNSTNNETSANNTVTKETSANTSQDTKKYFQESRLERENMYSEMLESYQSILANSGISSEQKVESQNKISSINSQRNGIMIAENLIKNKGFEDVIIFVNNESISVVVRADNLAEAEIAKIQSIVQRELNVKVENIHISNK